MAKRAPKLPTGEALMAAGKALRKKVPRAAHAQWKPRKQGRDVLAMIEESHRGRIKDLIPLREQRMLASPFAFLRGTANIMAFDLARTPVTGIRVQACGDAHVGNFGGYATPERRLVFDVNDFDETLPAPWEWDVKRLAASVAVAARGLGLAKRGSKAFTTAAVGAYRDAMFLYAPMSLLERWYQRIDAHGVPGLHFTARGGGRADSDPGIEDLMPKLAFTQGGLPRLKDNPPLMYHPAKDERSFEHVTEFIAQYRRSLIEDRRLLLDRYKLVDVAFKVAGVGSVGRRCLVGLLVAANGEALFLQFKEARASALEPHAGRSRYANHGQRVVEGQRLLQAAPDIFIGWSRIPALRAHFYVRQLRDHKTKARLEDLDARGFAGYAAFCGRALARAHAKFGDAAMISGYIGRGDAFDTAVASFAERYADQTEADYGVMKKALAVTPA